VEEHHPPPAKKKKVTTMKELDKLKALKQITVRKLPQAPGAAAEKLPIDPDNQKLNIFKKRAKVKDDVVKNSRESSPCLTITEVPQLKQEESRRNTNYDNVIDSVLKEPKTSSNKPPKNKNASSSCSSFLQIEMVVEEEVILSDTFSPPHTPSAPKTPEILSKADRMAEKRRKREKKQKNRPPKDAGMVIEEEVIDDDIMDGEIIDRPKTPEGPMPPLFPPFMSIFPAPGLIPPPPLTSPLLSGLPFPGNEASHPAMPNMPMPPASFMQPKSEPEPEPPAAEVMEEVVETELIVDKVIYGCLISIFITLKFYSSPKSTRRRKRKTRS
jgi:transcription initiation factor TFIID subunit 3